MNIFYLDSNPFIAASYLCDKHVPKMVVESAQILSTVLHIWGYGAPYKPTHRNHPCVVWASLSEANYAWVWSHMVGISKEYTARWGKTHKTAQYIDELQPLDEWKNATVPPQCVTEYCKQPDTVNAYRDYYIKDKAYMAQWKYSKQPEWFKV